MAILTREDIIAEYLDLLDFLWIPETSFSKKVRLEHFIYLDNINITDDFWWWNMHNLCGDTRCISSAKNRELWGFTDKRDITLFILRWA